jgi:hypothetical protein
MVKSKKQIKIPKTAICPSVKSPRIRSNPDDHIDTQTPAWQFHKCDQDHELWGWGKLSADEFLRLVKDHLRSLETMTWGAIKSAAGGRGHGTNSHPLSVAEFCKKARDRLRELNLEEYDELFSLRLKGQLRLYGIKEGRVLRFIWHDPHHGTIKEAYPTGERRK